MYELIHLKQGMTAQSERSARLQAGYIEDDRKKSKSHDTLSCLDLFRIYSWQPQVMYLQIDIFILILISTGEIGIILIKEHKVWKLAYKSQIGSQSLHIYILCTLGCA